MMKLLMIRRPGLRYVVACVICGSVALLCLPLVNHIELANIIMLFLLGVAIAAVTLGRGPAVFAAFCSVALFDLLFVPPRFSFSVNDGQYLLTFLVMLIVALMISHLTTILQKQLDSSQKQERQTRALYDYARELTGAMTHEQVAHALQLCLQNSLADNQAAEISSRIYLPDNTEQLVVSVVSFADRRIIHMVYQHGDAQEGECNIDQHNRTLYLPLRGSTRMRGVLAITVAEVVRTVFTQEKDFLHALASLTVTALERLHFVAVVQSTELQIQSEKLRSSILSALSHDIRTPLTALCGLADTLKLTWHEASPATLEMIDALGAQAQRLHNMVGNLLDMARLQSGKISLRKEWQPLEEIIGASIHLLGNALSLHLVTVTLASDLPLLQFDAVLMERVFCNLLENAAKYSPEGSMITVSAEQRSDMAVIRLHNEGSEFSDNGTEKLLTLFERGTQESSVPGFGMGLAICRSIVEAHGGKIQAFNAPEGGAVVELTLPLGTSPVVETKIISLGLSS